MSITVGIIASDLTRVPQYATSGSAGADVKANLDEPYTTIEPGEIRLIPTGIRLCIPDGYEVQLRPRSGLALKHGITLLNTPATIDSDYTGEIKVILINHGTRYYTLMNGERIAQMVLNKVERMNFEVVSNILDTERGSGGFGSSGKA